MIHAKNYETVFKFVKVMPSFFYILEYHKPLFG